MSPPIREMRVWAFVLFAKAQTSSKWIATPHQFLSKCAPCPASPFAFFLAREDDFNGAHPPKRKTQILPFPRLPSQKITGSLFQWCLKCFSFRGLWRFLPQPWPSQDRSFFLWGKSVGDRFVVIKLSGGGPSKFRFFGGNLEPFFKGKHEWSFLHGSRCSNRFR